MSEALKQGYRADGFEGETYSADETRMTGDYNLFKDEVCLKVPFVATFKFGRPRRYHWKRRRRA
jgi:hypothetical protein